MSVVRWGAFDFWFWVLGLVLGLGLGWGERDTGFKAMLGCLLCLLVLEERKCAESVRRRRWRGWGDAWRNE